MTAPEDPHAEDPYASAGPHRGLDPALDPDRFVPDEPGSAAGAAGPPAGAPLLPGAPPAGRLDPALDPDRYRGDASGKDLTELIGKDRSFEEERSPWLWLAGLAMVLGFLALVSLVFANLSPR